MHQRSIRTFDDKWRRQQYRIYYSIKWYLLTSNKWISELIILIVQAAANCSTFTNTNFDWFIDDIFFFCICSETKISSVSSSVCNEWASCFERCCTAVLCLCVNKWHSTNALADMHSSVHTRSLWMTSSCLYLIIIFITPENFIQHQIRCIRV